MRAETAHDDAERQRGMRQDAEQRVGGQNALALHDHEEQRNGHGGGHRGSAG